MVVEVIGGEIEEDEKAAYVDYVSEKFPGRHIEKITLKIDKDDPEYIDLSWILRDYPPFQRIRRITGYLVGTLERWNNGKRAEEADRVKHDYREVKPTNEG